MSNPKRLTKERLAAIKELMDVDGIISGEAYELWDHIAALEAELAEARIAEGEMKLVLESTEYRLAEARAKIADCCTMNDPRPRDCKTCVASKCADHEVEARREEREWMREIDAREREWGE